MRVYISLPITGKDIEKQKAHARSVAKLLEDTGHTPVSPFDNGLGADACYEDHLREDIKMLLGCDAAFFCKGWHRSPGCSFEHDVAMRCGIREISEYMPLSTLLYALKVLKGYGRREDIKSLKRRGLLDFLKEGDKA